MISINSLNEKTWIWDIETYINAFIVIAKKSNSDETLTFRIDDYNNDRPYIFQWLKKDVSILIGFNSLSYDFPLMYKLLEKVWLWEKSSFLKYAFNISSRLIHNSEKKNYPSKITHIDLFKINNFDNMAKSSSLKKLAFNFRMDNMISLPYSPETVLSKEQLNEVVEYCKNDIRITEELYKKTFPDICLRLDIANKYNDISVINMSAPVLGETIMMKEMILQSSLKKEDFYEEDLNDEREFKTLKKTHRDEISLCDVIFPYISFTSEPLAKMLSFLKEVKIKYNDDKTEIIFDKEKIKDLYPYYEELNKDSLFNVSYKGMQYILGIGGIHANINTYDSKEVFEESESWAIIDADVSSFYPNIAIKNKYYPEHLSEIFCNVYEGIYKLRKTFKKGTSDNLTYKNTLTAVFGKSMSKYSFLYDRLFGIKTTINGELLILTLIEMLQENIKETIILSANTDGICFMIKRDKLDKMNSIFEEYNKTYGLELETVSYKKMVLKNVNNYICQTTEGSIKRKGDTFIHKEAPGELEIYKNYSFLIINKLLERFYIFGENPEDIIKDGDFYDFFAMTNTKKHNALYAISVDNEGNHASEKEIQRVSRYYISGELLTVNGKTEKIGDGVILREKRSSGTSDFNKGYLATIINNIKKEDVYNFYYSFYLTKVNKIIK